MRKRAEEAEAACKRVEEELERVRKEENDYRVCIVHMHVTAGTRSCMHACMNIYTNTRAHIHTHTHARIYTYVYTYKYLDTHMHATLTSARVHLCLN